MDEKESLFYVTDHERINYPVSGAYDRLYTAFWDVVRDSIAMTDDGTFWNKYGSIVTSQYLFTNSLDYN